MQTNKQSLIFFVGMPGSGKSFWAKRLAQYWHLEAIDLDCYIAEMKGETITDMFDKGEGYFRQQEAAALKHVIEQSGAVKIIATGGGTPCYGRNMEIMLNCGIVVYLKTTIPQLVKYLKNSYLKRPLLLQQPEISLEEKLTQLLKKRQKDYEKSHFVIDVSNISLVNFAAQLSHYLHP